MFPPPWFLAILAVGVLGGLSWVAGYYWIVRRLASDHEQCWRALGCPPLVPRRAYTPDENRAMMRVAGFVLKAGYEGLEDPALSYWGAWLRALLVFDVIVILIVLGGFLKIISSSPICAMGPRRKP